MKQLIKELCERNREKSDGIVFGEKRGYVFFGDDLDKITQQTAEAVLEWAIDNSWEYFVEAVRKESWSKEELREHLT